MPRRSRENRKFVPAHSQELYQESPRDRFAKYQNDRAREYGLSARACHDTMGQTGLVVFNSPPAYGAALTWTGTFNWLCRFDDDSVEFNKFADQYWELQKLTFTSVVL